MNADRLLLRRGRVSKWDHPGQPLPAVVDILGRARIALAVPVPLIPPHSFPPNHYITMISHVLPLFLITGAVFAADYRVGFKLLLL